MDFLVNRSDMEAISFSAFLRVPLRASFSLSPAALDSSASSRTLIQFFMAVLILPDSSLAASVIRLTRWARRWSRAISIPNPNSAASSNRELPHAGPWPSSLVQYGVVGADAPQMEEQPVALATTMRSPKSWVMTLTYGVSPQPAQAPENSIRDCGTGCP